MKEQLRIDDSSKTLVEAAVKQLQQVWENSFEEMLKPAHV
jgi:hypothetical protein